MAIVVSDDSTVDVIPLLPPRIKYSEIEENISLLEAANLDNWSRPRNWLDRHRNYLNNIQCSRINSALSRIESLPLDEFAFIIKIDRFDENPGLDINYFLPTDKPDSH
jgi:hypothetical protein